MARVVRIAYSNLVQGSSAVIVPSSEETSLPRAALTRQGLGDVWRSKTGWTIVADENDKLEFDSGSGISAATIAAGTYATGALLAAAIVTALEAADSTPVWACSYSGTTFKFTISADVNIQLMFGTSQTWYEQSIHFDLGYTSTDKASAMSHLAEAASYQSRHVLNVDLGSAQALTVAIVTGTNLSSAATIRFDAHTATLVGVGMEDDSLIGTPDFSQALSGTSDPRLAFFSSQTKQYVRIVISDTTNTAGYVEVAIFFAGGYVTPSTPESWTWTKTYEQLSETFPAISGANHQVQRPRRAVYSLQWRTNSSADVSLFEALDLAMPAGKNFFISFDATDNPTTSTVYGFLRDGLVEQRNDGALYVMPLTFCEALE